MTGIAIAADAHFLLALLTGIALLLLGLASWRGWWPLWVGGWGLAVVALVVAFFFRDPERPGDRGPALYVSPADGRVLAIEEVDEPVYLGGPAVRISIFLGLLDVHVQRSPVAGVVEHVQHRPGGFAPASSGRAGTTNERTLIGIDTGRERVLLRQIAGLVARRIVTYVEEGELIEQGQRIGLIRFGSRVDAYLPPETIIDVEPGQRVWGGETILGWRPPDPDSAEARP